MQHDIPSNQDDAVTTLGCFETVSLPEFGLQDALAKIDTGAYSGALHCKWLELVESADGTPTLRFTLFHDGDTIFETQDFRCRKVRSASGHSQPRYVVTTKIIMQGREYPIRIGLSDRSTMKTDILIGRRFLRDNGMLVDVRINKELDDEGVLL